MNLEEINDIKYVLQFALDVIEEHGLEREINDDNWILGKSIEEQIAKLNHSVSHHVSQRSELLFFGEWIFDQFNLNKDVPVAKILEDYLKIKK